MLGWPHVNLHLCERFIIQHGVSRFPFLAQCVVWLQHSINLLLKPPKTINKLYMPLCVYMGRVLQELRSDGLATSSNLRNTAQSLCLSFLTVNLTQSKVAWKES